MPRNVYSEINLHLTWHTKHDAPVLVDAVENRAHHYLRHRALQTPGVIVHEVGGTEDHVHLVVSIPPTVAIADWIGQLKGASSHHINHEICNRKVLAWQDGYGVVSFGTKDLPWVVSYVPQPEEASRGAADPRPAGADGSTGGALVGARAVEWASAGPTPLRSPLKRAANSRWERGAAPPRQPALKGWPNSPPAPGRPLKRPNNPRRGPGGSACARRRCGEGR